MSRAYLFGDHQPPLLEVIDPSPADVDFIKNLGATQVDPLIGHIALHLTEAMIEPVAERWPNCETTGFSNPVALPTRRRTLVVRVSPDYL